MENQDFLAWLGDLERWYTKCVLFATSEIVLKRMLLTKYQYIACTMYKQGLSGAKGDPGDSGRKGVPGAPVRIINNFVHAEGSIY